MAAARNVDGARRAGYIRYRISTEGEQQLWLDPATITILARNMRTFTDDSGRLHARFTKNAAVLLQQGDGEDTHL